MTILRLVGGGVLRRAAWAVPAGVALAWLALPPPLPEAGPDAAQARWTVLHVPCFVLAAVVLAAAMQAWPLFGRERPGEGLLQHLVRGRLQGCGVAAAAALAVLLMLLAAGSLCLALLVGAAPVRAHAPFRVAGGTTAAGGADLALLVDPAAPLPLALAGGAQAVDSVRLRPLRYEAPGPFAPVHVRVLANGEALPPGWQAVRGSFEAIDFDAGGRQLDRIVIERREAGAPLALHGDAVEAVLAGTRSGLANACLAGAAWAWPAALALAAFCALRRLLAPGAAILLGSGLLMLVSLAGFTPNVAAVAAHARGRWLPTEPLLAASLPAAIATAGLLLLAALRREARV